MKQGLQEINDIISICDKISDYISKNGAVSSWTGGELYNDYRNAIKRSLIAAQILINLRMLFGL